MDQCSIPGFVASELRQLELEIPNNSLATLSRYLDLLLEVNQSFNLTAVRDRDAAWQRHIIDSLTLLPGLIELQQGGRIIDVGSGGGLPGIPLAVARPDLNVALLEATGKKARFLEKCAHELPLPNVTVLNARAETIGRHPNHRQHYDAAVCRAVGPLNELLEYTLPLVRVGGIVLAMKGPKLEGELNAAGDALHILGGGEFEVIEAYPLELKRDALILCLRKERSTPSQFPRTPGTPRQAPL